MTPSLSATCGSRSLALWKIEYILLNDVSKEVYDTIVTPQWRRQQAISPASGLWEELPTLPFPRWRESSSQGGQGTAFQNEITAQVPQLSRNNSASMDVLSRNRLLLRITDITGKVWIVGNHEEALKLSYQRSGGGGGSFAGYAISITGTVSHSATE